MRWSITLGSFKGTSVKVHVTFLLFLAWIGASAYARGGAAAAKDSVIFILAIFACVVLHEFGHILTARRYGVEAHEVTLLPIGGVADMNRMPQQPYQELLIALAGPAVNLVIAAALLIGLGAFEPDALKNVDDPALGLLPRLAAANVFLAVFNMVPAFPMDGGRVLRAALAMWLGQEKATRIAVQVGQVLAFGLGFLGLFGNPILLFIAIFIFIAAAGEAQMTFVAAAARGLRARDAMETRIAKIERGATIGEAVEILLATSQEEFPVVDASGSLAGLLSRNEIIDAVKANDPSGPIAPFVKKETPVVDAAAPLEKALEQLTSVAAVGVLGPGGELVGLVTRQSLAEVILIKDAQPNWRFARR
jgi:Zn-dependent protease/CBS domain-containing protein